MCVYGKPPQPVDSEDQCVLCVCVETSLSYFLSEGGAVVNDGITGGLHTIHNSFVLVGLRYLDNNKVHHLALPAGGVVIRGCVSQRLCQ